MTRSVVGAKGELTCAQELGRRGWEVEDLNQRSRNFANADLRIQKGNTVYYVQVKASGKGRG